MRRTVAALATVVTAMLVAGGVALALPAESPDNTPMLNGPARAFAQVGTNVWAGGNFSEVRRRDGSLVDRVGGLAVFDSATGEYVDVAPALGGDVMDVAVYGDDVLVAGSFSGPSSTQKNLVALDGKTGAVIRWYNAPPLKSVLAAPQLGRVYGGGVSLQAFDFSTGKKLWTRAKTIVDPDIRTHKTAPAYRDLELDGPTIWAACACDWVQGPDGVAKPAKALVKLSIDGAHDSSYSPKNAGVGAFGISVAHLSGTVYLGAGGNDFLAAYSKADGSQAWRRDTSGSAQVVEIMGNSLVVGGHFWEIADQSSDRCGGRSSNNAVTLDPYGECQTRHGLAAYSLGGTLDPGWAPMLEGRYNLAWALHPDAATGRLHVGGEFLTVNGVKQTYYARLSS